MLGDGWLDAIHPDDRAFAERQWREAIEACTPVDAEFRLHAPEGGWRWTNVRAAPVVDDRGAIEQWAGMNIDIDARKRTEAALRRSEENYRTLFDSIDEGFAEIEFITDDGGSVVDWRYLKLNPAFTRLTGLADVTGRFISDIVPDLEPVWAKRYTQLLTSGEPLRFEEYTASHDMWLDVYVTLVGEPGTRRAVQLYSNITTRKKAEAALRDSEARQSVLLHLTDALRPLTDPIRVLGETTRILGEYMQADRTFIAMMEPDGVNLDVYHEYLRPGASSVLGHHNFDSFGAFVSPQLINGHIMAVEDIATLPLTEAERAHYADVGIAAYLLVPLVREGRFAACFTCNHQTPRVWTEADKNIVRQVADRTWAAMERARAEAALHESEERFMQFANASSFGLWIRDAETLTMEYASPAVGDIYGINSEAIMDGVEGWAALIVPEDRQTALDHIAEAREGTAVIHEFRIQRPSDGSFRWVRNTDFPLDQSGVVQRIGGIAEDVTKAKLAVEHQGVLLAELQHRVRNIMAMIRSMMRRSADGATEVADYEALLEGRLLALARVQTLLTRQGNSGGSLRDIVESEVSAQAHHGGQFELVGPDVHLSPKAVEVLTLALHELATNALKYGALSTPAGRLRVGWALFEKRSRSWLAIDWVETGAPPRGPVTRRGFGSDLIEGKIPYELGGTGRITIESGGAQCRLEFPLKEGESILETDAPSPTTIFGGVLDMAGAPDLTGRSVLVVEDDYYLAGDTAAALRGAGATVLGPCPSEDATLELLKTETPTHAVLDLNLGGGGPRFAIAHALRARGVPFVFLTGYDPDAVPSELSHIVRLQKPVAFRAIVEAVGQL